MTDYKNRFGAVTSSGSENVLDFQAIDPRAAMQSHRTGEQHDSSVVFFATADITAGTATPKLQDSDDNSTFADLVTGPATTKPKAGILAVIPMPKTHKRYVRAMVTGTLTGGSITAFLEPGPRQ
jgi:hypothetical protein